MGQQQGCCNGRLRLVRAPPSAPRRPNRLIWIAALLLPHAMCTLDEGPLAEAGTKLQACEAHVMHLTAEIGRLQEQVSALRRAGAEPTRGAIEAGASLRAGTVNEAPSTMIAPSGSSAGTKASADLNRRRQEVVGGILRHRLHARPPSARACRRHPACLRAPIAVPQARRACRSSPRRDARSLRRRGSLGSACRPAGLTSARPSSTS